MKLAKALSPQFIAAYTYLSQQRMPIKKAMEIKKSVKKLFDENKIFDEARTDLVKRICEKDKNGKPKTADGGITFTIPKNKIPAFNKELETVLGKEIKLPTVNLSELDEKVQFSPAELEMLDEVLIIDKEK